MSGTAKPQKTRQTADTLPCRHTLDVSAIDRAKDLLTNLPTKAPDAITGANIDPNDWDMVLRAAVESLRGTASATTSQKYGFLEAVLDLGVQHRVFTTWEHIGSKGRQDYKVILPNDCEVAVEAKGCPDGNNSTIWDRPSWADEFIVWFMCPESLAHPAGQGLWSGISTRLVPKMTAERTT
ncbi:MAG: hypothetical protein U1E22_04695, partial [Coriobacteriia bacterium]|nr:hypothetical protein [Coriobacteriia bacterium]